MDDCVRVEWEEGREGELYFVIALKACGVWSFFDRSTWELCWYPTPSTRALIQRAESAVCGNKAPIAA
jgi:hypothetical protein